MANIIVSSTDFFLRKFAWKPILEAVEGREEGIKNALDAADKAKADMQALSADNERILAEAKIERDSLLKEAREMKENIISEAKEKLLWRQIKLWLQQRSKSTTKNKKLLWN